MKNKRNFLKFLILLLAGIIVIFYLYKSDDIKNKLYKINLPNEIVNPNIEEEIDDVIVASEIIIDENKIYEKDDDLDIIPVEFNLSVPFTVQAPDADWSMPYKEACEEASLLMVHYYLQGEDIETIDIKKEIDEMVAWQMEYFGEHKDLNINEIGEMAQKYLGYDFVIIEDLNYEKIKKYISREYPVIIPAAGRELGNPYFRTPGPLYHMLVIKGYTDKMVITNDPGTKRGQDFVYKIDVLMNSIHDWTGDKPIGSKVGLILVKK